MIQGFIVTNNDKVYRKHQSNMLVFFMENGSYLNVLEKSRDLVHQGARLLSHPMAGSMKPNQTPYRSVLMERVSEPEGDARPQPVDLESLRLIENSIETAKKFLRAKQTPAWSPDIREDFKTIDLSIIDSAIR